MLPQKEHVFGEKRNQNMNEQEAKLHTELDRKILALLRDLSHAGKQNALRHIEETYIHKASAGK